MTALKGLIIATAVAGSIALAGAKPAPAQGLTNEELVIGGLLVASGLLIYEQVTNDNDDRYRWRDDRYRWRDDRDRWRDDRRFQPIPQSFPRDRVAPPSYRFAPPPPGWAIVQNRPWQRDLRTRRGHEFKRGRGHDDHHRHGHGHGHNR